MYKIDIDIEKNRLYLTLLTMSTKEGPDFLAEIEASLAQLENGFSVISDITRFSVNDPKGNVWAEKIITFLAEKGMKRAVRVNGISSKEKEVEDHGYLVSTAKTVKDAETFLDQI